MYRLQTRLTAALILFLGAVVPVHGQSQWLGPVEGHAFWIEMVRPDIEDATFASSAWQVGFRAPVTPSLALVGEVPFAHGADEDFDADETTTIGNPYFGIEYTGAGGRVTTELGVRAPLVSDESQGTFVGLISEFVDRLEAFAPDFVPITAAVRYEGPADEGLALRVRGGGSFWIPVDGGDVETFGVYGLQGWYARRWLAGFGLTGRFIVTEGDLDVGDRFAHQVGGTIGYDFNGVRPAVEVRIPIDEDLHDEAPYSIGIGLTIQR